MEQRICRCHRQGQKSDVLVINMLSKENFADVRMLELINKRTLQFNGIFGMSDDIVGNFDAKLKDILSEFRTANLVAESFYENLREHKTSNEKLVSQTEDILFTTFTKSIADKITVTPKYIKEQSKEANDTLWEIIKYYFTNIKPGWYSIDDEKQTLTLVEGYRRPYLFEYREDQFNRRKNYEGYSKYGMSPDFKPHYGRITLTSILAKGILKELDTVNKKEAIFYVASDIEPCDIGLYNYSITAQKGEYKLFQTLLIGQTQSGKILTEDECRKILSLPVVNLIAQEGFLNLNNEKLFDDFEGVGNLDDKVSKDAILKEYLKSKEGSIEYEIEKIKLLAGRKKSGQEVKLNELRSEIKELKKQLESGKFSGLEELKTTKRLRVIEKELKQKEEGLFFDKAQIDIETEKAIAELTQSYNFDVFVSNNFKLRILKNQA